MYTSRLFSYCKESFLGRDYKFGQVMIMLVSISLSPGLAFAQERCYWMENYSGRYEFVPASHVYGYELSFNQCYLLDSCSGGKSHSGGGCYKWAEGPKAQRIPWPHQTLSKLREYLAIPISMRASIDSQGFAKTPLSKEDAKLAKAEIWNDLRNQIRQTRKAEHEAKRIEIDGATLRYETVTLGYKPKAGRSLFISMHGGGATTNTRNDREWRNQINLAREYNPQNALWVAPRAPTNTWNMWFQDSIDPLFSRLVTNMIVFEDVDPNKIYLTGYSAGGDGVYGLAPRSADRWAGAAMSAGHPNGISIMNLRNLPFAIHVGGLDTAYNRDIINRQYGQRLDLLQALDPAGYPHQWQVHEGLHHWMYLADKVAIPFLQDYVRNPVPNKVVWEQHSVTDNRSYWLAIDEDQRKAGTKVVASYAEQTVTLHEVNGLETLKIRFTDDMLDMDQTIRIVGAGVNYEGQVSRNIGTIAGTMFDREDPAIIFTGEVSVKLP
jgi:hypothetical protein